MSNAPGLYSWGAADSLILLDSYKLIFFWYSYYWGIFRFLMLSLFLRAGIWLFHLACSRIEYIIFVVLFTEIASFL